MSNNAVLKYVDFDLPFLICIKDGMIDEELEAWATAYIQGKPLPFAKYAPHESPGQERCIIGGCLPVYLPDKKDIINPIVVTLDNVIQPGIIFLKRVNPQNNGLVRALGEVPGDRSGRATFSSVKVIFKLEQIKSEFYWNMQVFSNLAIQAVNLFIENYRVVANKSYVYPVTLATIQKFIITTVFEDGKLQTQEFGMGLGPMVGLGATITEVQEKLIRDNSIHGVIPSIEDTLEIEIKNHLELEQWRLAVIGTAILFETWVKKFIRKHMKQQGKVNHEIEKRFRKPNGESKSITSIVVGLLKSELKFDFAVTQNYKLWAKNVRDLRNDIVHGTVTNISREQAYNAHEIVNKSIVLISENAK